MQALIVVVVVVGIIAPSGRTHSGRDDHQGLNLDAPRSRRGPSAEFERPINRGM
jgi:hypothetical protein